MVNISFSDSLSGSLKMAGYYAKKNNDKIQDLEENVISLWLNLDVGDISENPFGTKRERDYIKIFGDKNIFGDENTFCMQKFFREQTEKINKIENLVKQGHKIRIWYTERADELCGFCYMLYMLDLWGIENKNIFYVKLPLSTICDSGEYTLLGGSGEFDSEILPKLVLNQKSLTESFKKYHINQWENIKAENAEMRISICGRLVSVNADFYDSIILSEIEKQDEIFKEAQVIGNCIFKLCVDVNFVAWRVEKMIENGLLEIVEYPSEMCGYYCKVLKKIGI